MKPAIGTDIESVCSRCGTSWHVVVAMVDANVMKVECKQCHNVHQHRTAKAAAAKRKTGTKKTARSAAAAFVEAQLDRPPRAYAITETFQPGDRVDHATFGRGVVQRAAGPGKIEILFDGQVKVLAQAKPPSRTFS
jgi:hypothetical protein